MKFLKALNTRVIFWCVGQSAPLLYQEPVITFFFWNVYCSNVVIVHLGFLGCSWVLLCCDFNIKVISVWLQHSSVLLLEIYEHRSGDASLQCWNYYKALSGSLHWWKLVQDIMPAYCDLNRIGRRRLMQWTFHQLFC